MTLCVTQGRCWLSTGASPSSRALAPLSNYPVSALGVFDRLNEHKNNVGLATEIECLTRPCCANISHFWFSSTLFLQKCENFLTATVHVVEQEPGGTRVLWALTLAILATNFASAGAFPSPETEPAGAALLHPSKSSRLSKTTAAHKKSIISCLNRFLQLSKDY